MTENLRNIAIVAHVDHGKTTLVDQLLRQSGTLENHAGAMGGSGDRVMDSNDLERERGITILSKNTAIRWHEYRINIIDTPGHADFGGEVERVLSMADSVLLLVDAVDGPMPQTRFVTRKAFAHGLRPIVVINKIDRDGARANWVLDQTFDLFDRLGATEEQLDFPVVYTSALLGHASVEAHQPGTDMTPLFETIVNHCPPPPVDLDGPLQLQISSLAYSSYVGAIGIGRIRRGEVMRNQPIRVIDRDGQTRTERVGQVFGFLGLDRVEVERAQAGDIVAITGIDQPHISDTLCDPDSVEALPSLTVDEPTISMQFETNSSPFAGKDGKFLTSRQIIERLDREVLSNVALRVEPTADPEKFRVSGRGEMHLAILLETMRREGFEIAVSRPQVIVRERDGYKEEPFESLTIDVDEHHQGAVMEAIGSRGGEMTDMAPDGRGRVRIDYMMPARGLIGFQTMFRTLTSGTGLLHHIFDHYGVIKNTDSFRRNNGVMIANATGKAVGYALFNLQSRGQMLVDPGEPVYEGQLVGIHSRANDLTVNPLKAKQLTNVRAAGKDDNVVLTPPIRFTLEQAMEFIEDDELMEVTPQYIRLRKRHLTEQARKRAARG